MEEMLQIAKLFHVINILTACRPHHAPAAEDGAHAADLAQSAADQA